MASELIVLEQTLTPMRQQFTDLLAGIMPAERLIQSVIVSVQKNPKLLDANRQSLLNTVRGSAILGLEMDGVTGQAFPIPFAGMVQLVIGYKGYNTLGARAGLTITGECVYERDAFDFDLGEGWVKHRPPLNGDRGKMIGAWAKAAALNRPAVVSWLPIADIYAIKKKSPGAKKSDSPWNDETIGFAAMGSKSAKRRLTRSTPLTVEAPQMHLAARMEEAFEERGRLAYVAPNNQVEEIVIEGTAAGTPGVADLTNKPPEMSDLLKSARVMCMTGDPAKVEDWFRPLSDWQRLELKPHLPELRRMCKDPLNFLMEEGREAAGGGKYVLDAWWANLPDDWKSKLETFYRDTL